MAPSNPSTPRKQKSHPKTVSDFAILPLSLPALPGLPAQCRDAKHFLYLKPHAAKIPGLDDDRSVFIANVPFDATEDGVRELFKGLGGGMVERVDFEGASTIQKDGAPKLKEQRKKRKREESEALLARGVVEDAESVLPKLWDTLLRKSGSTAVVVFVDKKSARGAIKGVHSAIKEERTVEWKSGEKLGVERYKSHLTYLYPPPATLQSTINSYLTAYSSLELLSHKLRKTSASVPDADGFVTVSRNASRSGAARIADAERKRDELEERRKNNGVKEDFYRFQNREKRKEREGELKRRFEEDRRRVEGMRQRRGRVRPEV